MTSSFPPGTVLKECVYVLLNSSWFETFDVHNGARLQTLAHKPSGL